MWVLCDNSTLSALAELDFLTRLTATGFRLTPSLIEEARLRVKRGLES